MVPLRLILNPLLSITLPLYSLLLFTEAIRRWKYPSSQIDYCYSVCSATQLLRCNV